MKRHVVLLIATLIMALTLPVVAQTVENYSIILSNADSGVRWWVAPYSRVLSPGVGWTDGDRSGYRCAYGFLYGENSRGRQVMLGRFTFIRIEAATGYARINDSGMAEGIRYYDGTLDRNDAGGKELGDCPAATGDYESFGGDQRPTIQFVRNGQALEVRDYKTVVADPSVTFQQVSKTDTRIGVVAYEDGLPVIEVYYDSLVRGVTLTSDLG